MAVKALKIKVAAGIKTKRIPTRGGALCPRLAFCDLRCACAEFAKADALDGSCRTFMSLWCRKLRRHVTKNAPCEARYGRRRPTTGF
jgi:hypothetical protein